MAHPVVRRAGDMTYSQLPSGSPAIRKTRNDYECSAAPCLLDRPIDRGEVCVTVHDNAPQMVAGRARTDLRHNHFSVRYHVACFVKSYTTDQRTSFLRYGLAELPGYDKYKPEVDALLRDAEDALNGKR